MSSRRLSELRHPNNRAAKCRLRRDFIIIETNRIPILTYTPPLFQTLNNAVNPVFSKPKPQPKVEPAKKTNGVEQNGVPEEPMDDSSPKVEDKSETDTKGEAPKK